MGNTTINNLNIIFLDILIVLLCIKNWLKITFWKGDEILFVDELIFYKSVFLFGDDVKMWFNYMFNLYLTIVSLFIIYICIYVYMYMIKQINESFIV